MLIMMMAMLMMMFGVQGAHFAFPFFSPSYVRRGSELYKRKILILKIE